MASAPEARCRWARVSRERRGRLSRRSVGESAQRPQQAAPQLRRVVELDNADDDCCYYCYGATRKEQWKKKKTEKKEKEKGNERASSANGKEGKGLGARQDSQRVQQQQQQQQCSQAARGGRQEGALAGRGRSGLRGADQPDGR